MKKMDGKLKSTYVKSNWLTFTESLKELMKKGAAKVLFFFCISLSNEMVKDLIIYKATESIVNSPGIWSTCLSGRDFSVSSAMTL